MEKPALMGGGVCGVLSSAEGSWADERGARLSRGKEPLKPQDHDLATAVGCGWCRRVDGNRVISLHTRSLGYGVSV